MKKTVFSPRALLPLLLLPLASACSSPAVRPDADDVNSRQVLSESSVDVSFVRGHNLHRFFAEAQAEAVHAQSYVDRQLLKDKSVNQARYLELFTKLRQFVVSRQPSSVAAATQTPAAAASGSDESPCRTPFNIVLRLRGSPLTAQGCRVDGDSPLGKIVREAEFLLYSSP